MEGLGLLLIVLGVVLAVATYTETTGQLITALIGNAS